MAVVVDGKSELTLALFVILVLSLLMKPRLSKNNDKKRMCACFDDARWQANKLESLLAGRGVELDELTAMRFSFWLAGLAKAGGCAVSEFVDLPVLADISSMEFPLYDQGRRKPSHSTLNLVEQALPRTRVRSDLGPDGTNLWGILEGKREANQSHLDTELARTGFTSIRVPRF